MPPNFTMQKRNYTVLPDISSCQFNAFTRKTIICCQYVTLAGEEAGPLQRKPASQYKTNQTHERPRRTFRLVEHVLNGRCCWLLVLCCPVHFLWFNSASNDAYTTMQTCLARQRAANSCRPASRPAFANSVTGRRRCSQIARVGSADTATFEAEVLKVRFGVARLARLVPGISCWQCVQYVSTDISRAVTASGCLLQLCNLVSTSLPQIIWPGARRGQAMALFAVHACLLRNLLTLSYRYAPLCAVTVALRHCATNFQCVCPIFCIAGGQASAS